MTALEKLFDRRSSRCLEYGLKSLKHSQNSRFFPRNPSLDNQLQVRDREPFIVNFARTAQYKNSAIPDIQRRLNENSKNIAEAAERGPGCRSARGSGPETGGAARARRPG